VCSSDLFELAIKALIHNVKIIAPWREWTLRSREDAINYAKKRGIPVPVTKAKPYSSDANLWHISYEGGIMEELTNEYDESMFKMTVSAQKAPDKPEYITIGFQKGEPISINGKKTEPVELISELNQIGGKNAIGRTDMIENRLVGMKSRGVYEAPAAAILYAAHQELEMLTLDRDTLHFKQILSHKYAQLAYNGLWFSPLRQALDAFIESSQKYATGEIKLKLYKGTITPVSRKAQHSLYSQSLATFGRDEVYNQKDAQGFINLFGLSIKAQALMRK
jgi:argininosuccinate synthase